MNRTVYILFGTVFLLGCLLGAPGDNNLQYPHYQIHIKLDPGTRLVQVNGHWAVPSDSIFGRKLTFYLHKNLKFSVLTLNGKNVVPAIDAESKSPFMPDSVLMRIPAVTETEKAVLRFRYSGELSSLPEYFANVVSPGWVEMGLYFPWFPYQPELSPFTYKVTVENIPNRKIFGMGVKNGENGHTDLEMNSPTNDIVICASGDVKQYVERFGASTLKIWHHTLDNKTLETMSSEISQILVLYNQWFGKNPQDIALVESKRKKGGGYARIGAVFFGGFEATKYHSKREAYARYFAHELAHLWWFRAETNSWEDWLNESFAEYSALMIIRKLYGPESYNRRLERKQADLKDTPAIINFNRGTAAHRWVTRVLYNKGPALLAQLEEKTGNTAFLRLLKNCFENNIVSTSDFLLQVKEICGKEVSRWFKTQLEK